MFQKFCFDTPKTLFDNNLRAHLHYAHLCMLFRRSNVSQMRIQSVAMNDIYGHSSQYVRLRRTALCCAEKKSAMLHFKHT